MFKTRPLQISSNPVKSGILLLGSLALAAWGVWFAGLGPDELEEIGFRRARRMHPWFGWVTAAFFGYCVLLLLREVLDRTPQLLVQDEGLTWRRWGRKEIPWREITQIELKEHRGAEVIAIRLRDPDRYGPRFPYSLLSRLGGSLSRDDLTIPTATLHRLPEDIFATMDHFWRNNR